LQILDRGGGEQLAEEPRVTIRVRLRFYAHVQAPLPNRMVGKVSS